MEVFNSALITSLNISRKNRSPDDIARIYAAMSKLSFFNLLREELPEHQLHLCSHYVKLQACSTGSVVITHGDRATAFYIILQGLVGVSAPQKTSEGLAFKEVCELTDGSSFGELGLNDDKPRAATVYCKADTHFLVLSKKHYKMLLESAITLRQKNLIHLLKQNYLLSSLSNSSLIKLSYLFTQQNLSHKSVLYSEGSELKQLYIVRHGEFRLTKTVLLPPLNPKKKQQQYPRKEIVEIAIVSKGYFLNAEDWNDHSYSVTATCISSTGSVLMASKAEIAGRILNSDSQRSVARLYSRQQRRQRQTEKIIHTRTILQSSLPTSPHRSPKYFLGRSQDRVERLSYDKKPSHCNKLSSDKERRKLGTQFIPSSKSNKLLACSRSSLSKLGKTFGNTSLSHPRMTCFNTNSRVSPVSEWRLSEKSRN